MPLFQFAARSPRISVEWTVVTNMFLLSMLAFKLDDDISPCKHVVHLHITPAEVKLLGTVYK
jgi:hypothetical protein